ncbi:hypothetical protein FHX37_3333 [Haloactinospora alba]|uniref:DUF4352 domain-containing protein n=1 Tax=Haloactinospora alba TaxID=405555 RepID=A0A543NNA6_9ACTN|nr:DUF4352 domain-containing protein [Haloactinospora alba]TQN33319.1 hypothetical protein FHX37_3333 [Haloactinospora alba]
MKKWAWLAAAAGALVLGLVAGWFGRGMYASQQLEGAPGDRSEESERGQGGAGGPDVATLAVGDSADIRTMHGDRYELTVDDVRYYEEITGTAYGDDRKDNPVFVTEPEDYLFAAVDVTITNTGSDAISRLGFARHVGADGEVSEGKDVKESGDGTFHEVVPEDVGSDAPGEDLLPATGTIPPDTTERAVGVVAVSEPDGYLYGSGNETWRIELPDRE